MAVQPRRAAPTAVQYVNFGRPEDYSKGGGLPEGDYLWSSLQFIMFQPTKKDGTVVGPAKLAVQINMEPPGGAATPEEVRTQNYSLGTNAHLTFAPDPETGKKLILVPNGPATSLYESTNWQIILKSLWDAGMPEDTVTDDLSVLEGIVCHMTNVPEPSERKGFRTSTSEMQAEQKDRKIPVVLEVKQAPWLTGAAVPARPVARPAAPAPRAAAPAAKPNGRPAPPPAAPEGDYEAAAVEAISNVIEAAGGQGIKKLLLRTSVFKSLGSNPDKQAIMDTYFGDEGNLEALLNQIGYGVRGADVVLI